MPRKSILLIILLVVVTNLITSYSLFHYFENKEVKTNIKESISITSQEKSEGGQDILNSSLLENKIYSSCMKTYDTFCATQTVTEEEKKKSDEESCREKSTKEEITTCLDTYYLSTSKNTQIDSCNKIQDKKKKIDCESSLEKYKIMNTTQKMPLNIRVLKCGQISDSNENINCKQTVISQELEKLNINISSIEKIDTTPCKKFDQVDLIEKCIQDFTSLKRLTTH